MVAPTAFHEIVHETPAARQRSVDDWGRDSRLIRLLTPVASLRWDVHVIGSEHVRRGAALIVVNTRSLALTPVLVAWALSEAIDRPVRFVGRPDTVPFGPLLQRVGGLLAHPAEVAGALRAGEVVLLGAAATRRSRQAGSVDPALLAAAICEQVPVHVAASTSTMIGRQVRVDVAPPMRTSRMRRGPLAEVELAEQAQHRLQAILDSSTGAEGAR